MRRIPFDICLGLVVLSVTASSAPPGSGSLFRPDSRPSGSYWARPPQVPTNQFPLRYPVPQPTQGALQPSATPVPAPVAGNSTSVVRQTSGGFPATNLGTPQPFPMQPARPAAEPRPQQQVTSPPVTNTTVAVKSSRGLWFSTTESTGKRAIEVARFGQGPKFILFLGSIHGNEAESIELMDALAQLVHDHPPPPELTILLVRTPNPDGMTESMRTNSAGVDLNRNFPSPAFTSSPTRETGPRPASEAETRYMLQILQQYQPARVVHLRSSIGEKPLVLVNAHWPAEICRPYLPKSANMSEFSGGFKAGSLEEFVTEQLRTPMATIHLPPKGFQQMSSVDVLRFATAYVSAVPAGARDQAQRQAVPESRSEPATPAVATDGKKGDVELLPPPPELVPTSLTGRPRFEELPPPPNWNR